MIFAPNNGAIGVQPAGTKTRCINKSGGALALGDVVVTSFAHSGVLYPPADTVASLELSPFSCVVKADGSPNTPGFIGVVTSLLANAGADGTAVEVQYGGIASAKVGATGAAIAIGSALTVHDTAGQFGNGGASTATIGAAIALGACADGATATIPVLLSHNLYFGVAI